MNVRNVHERLLSARAEKAGALIDRLASPEDALWPWDRWPVMRLDRPLGVGASGGHGPVRYTVEAYEPGCRLVFRFRAPRGFLGTHAFDIEEVSRGVTRLRHVLEMDVRGVARLSWPLFYRPLHDALLEDALDRAEAHVGGSPRHRQWSPRVRLLRQLASRGRRPPRR